MPKKITGPVVRFHVEQPGFSLKSRTKLKAFLVDLFRKEQTPVCSLDYIFCSDKYLLKINRDFLRHDYYTDIITFNLAAPGQCAEGEIYISIPRVKENGELLGEYFYRELHRVIFHGALHLCGYSDKTKKEKTEMRSKENQYLGKYLH